MENCLSKVSLDASTPLRRGFWRPVEGNPHSRVDSLVRRSLQRIESFARTTGSFHYVLRVDALPSPGEI